MHPRSRFLTRDVTSALLLALAPLLYFLPATLGRLVLAADDALIFGMPLRIAAAQMIRHGNLPLWNPYIFSGMPLFASAQAGVLFPLNWSFLMFGPRGAMNFAVLASYSVAGMGAFLYARRSGTNLLGGIVTGLVWQMCGVTVGQVSHTNVLHVFAILPWLFWAIDGYVMRGRAKDGALIAIIVALQVFAGHQQTLAYSLLLAGAYVLVNATAPESQSYRRAWLLALPFLALGLLLAAVQIVPTAELLRLSLRSASTYEFFSSYSLPPIFLLTYFAPFLAGGGDGTLFRAPYISEPYYLEYIGYVGLAPLILALLAPIITRDRKTVFWAWVAVISLALALGGFWPFELYRLVYHIPVLNLFRVPARHLMELDFALAVLAGRALTFLPQTSRMHRIMVTVASGSVVLFVVIAAVTFLRPAEFHLGRIAPVSILRAPELFMPIFLAALTCWLLVRFARQKKFSGAFLLALIVCDLALWGQFTGWRVHSPRRDHPIFRTPDVVKTLRRTSPNDQFRILTLDRTLVDALANGGAMPGAGIELQPDSYMIHGIANAAGYDGFGLKRYRRLAGDMKVWGEFPDQPRSLLTSRELDLLNVRYLVAAAQHAGTPQPLPATVQLGDFLFYEHDLAVPFLEGGRQVDFDTPPMKTTRVALVTNLSWSIGLSDGTVAGKITLRADDGRTFAFELHVGTDTSEWAYDRPALKGVTRHSRATVATSSAVADSEGNFDGHNFVTSFVLPEKVTIIGGRIEAARIAEMPKFGLGVQRVSFIDETEKQTIPLRSEWIAGNKSEPMVNSRWREIKRSGATVIYENARALPRTWLGSETRGMPDEEKLEVIRTGQFADGSIWHPEQTVLVGAGLKSNETNIGQAKIVRYEPNTVEISTRNSSAAVLVLADNHYPGWHVEVDGKRTPLLRVDYNLRGVQLAPGEHKVRFSYRPRSVMLGALISLLSAAGLGLWCWRRA